MIDLKQATRDCLGPSPTYGTCNAKPRYSVSEHIGQDTDYRVCGLHLTWIVNEFKKAGFAPVVVATLQRGTS